MLSYTFFIILHNLCIRTSFLSALTGTKVFLGAITDEDLGMETIVGVTIHSVKDGVQIMSSYHAVKSLDDKAPQKLGIDCHNSCKPPYVLNKKKRSIEVYGLPRFLHPLAT